LPRVVVIGGGPSGLVAIKNLLNKAEIICYESKSDVGGIWHPDKFTEESHPNIKEDAYYQTYGALHSSMYEDLVCNIPKCLMCFKGFPHRESASEFLTN
jgi:cation diffusion facilitator CzcD-associated flavoprotein CzcO